LIEIIAAVLLGLIGLFVAANVLAYAIFRQFPSLLLSENERLQKQHLGHLSGPLLRYIPEWFDIKAEEWKGFCTEYRRWFTAFTVYDDFVVFKHPARRNKYINVSESGFRIGTTQGPWPPSSDFYNVFFFGGSTTIHVGPDWTTIPNHLQDILNASNAVPKPARIYNFGRGSYFSTQERILFQQILLDRIVPDMAIFLDGLNDFYFFDGRTAMAGYFTDQLEEHNRKHYENLHGDLYSRPKWQMLGEFGESLPLTRALTLVARAFALKNPTPETVMYKPIAIADERLALAMHRYLDNTRQIDALSREYGVDTLFVVQPIPAYKYDLKSHIVLNAQFGLGGHERSGQGYPLLADHFARQGMPANFVWLADMQEKIERPLYLDQVHYTAEMSRMVAAAIRDALVARGSLAGKPTPRAPDSPSSSPERESIERSPRGA